MNSYWVVKMNITFLMCLYLLYFSRNLFSFGWPKNFQLSCFFVYSCPQLRTFLIRNGLSTLFKDGPSAYKAYYLRYGCIVNISCVGNLKSNSRMKFALCMYIVVAVSFGREWIIEQSYVADMVFLLGLQDLFASLDLAHTCVLCYF